MIKILPIGINSRVQKRTVLTQNSPVIKPLAYDSVNFTGLMPNHIKSALKMCVFDLDETLLHGHQSVRDKVLAFAKEDGKKLVYSSARTIESIDELIDKGVLVKPDFCICANGAHIYKNVSGKFEEITSWSDDLAKNFHKDQIRVLMARIARKHMFPQKVWAKIPPENISELNPEFRGSKITEYNGVSSHLDIRFAVTRDVLKPTIREIKKALAKKGFDANVSVQVFTPEQTTLEGFKKYYADERALNIFKHVNIRRNPDGSYNSLNISANTDKGNATEYIRNLLGLKENEVFAAGDAENDHSHVNKGYFFTVVGNATKGLRNSVAKLLKTNKELKEKVFSPSGEGVHGIWEVVEP